MYVTVEQLRVARVCTVVGILAAVGAATISAFLGHIAPAVGESAGGVFLGVLALSIGRRIAEARNGGG
jgi:hypothetical protein